MNLKEKIESHPVVYFLGALAVGFGAGLAAYKFILDAAKLDTVRSGTYVSRAEFDELRGKSVALVEQSERKCADEIAKLTREIERFKTEESIDLARIDVERRTLAERLAQAEGLKKKASTDLARTDAERRTLAKRLAQAEGRLAEAGTHQCPGPVLDAYAHAEYPAIGDVAYCIAKTSEMASAWGVHPRTVLDNEVHLFLSDAQSQSHFFCSISCLADSTSIICNGPSRVASRGWVSALWEKLSRK